MSPILPTNMVGVKAARNIMVQPTAGVLSYIVAECHHPSCAQNSRMAGSGVNAGRRRAVAVRCRSPDVTSVSVRHRR